MKRVRIALFIAAALAAGVQTWRIERMQREWAEIEAETTKALLKQKSDAAATISAMRGDFDEIMEKAYALPDADACGLDADRVRALDSIR